MLLPTKSLQIFGKVLEDREICKELLEILLDIKIEKIEFPEIQKELSASYKSKSIRLDVFASDPKRNFDIEMQMFKHEALPQRMRYYQSLMDIDALLKGKKYTELKENYVIFICVHKKRENFVVFYFMCYHIIYLSVFSLLSSKKLCFFPFVPICKKLDMCYNEICFHTLQN